MINGNQDCMTFISSGNTEREEARFVLPLVDEVIVVEDTLQAWYSAELLTSAFQKWDQVTFPSVPSATVAVMVMLLCPLNTSSDSGSHFFAIHVANSTVSFMFLYKSLFAIFIYLSGLTLQCLISLLLFTSSSKQIYLDLTLLKSHDF